METEFKSKTDFVTVPMNRNQLTYVEINKQQANEGKCQNYREKKLLYSLCDNSFVSALSSYNKIDGKCNKACRCASWIETVRKIVSRGEAAIAKDQEMCWRNESGIERNELTVSNPNCLIVSLRFAVIFLSSPSISRD